MLLVGGNIAGQTRVLTTAIVLETSKGEFGLAQTYGPAFTLEVDKSTLLRLLAGLEPPSKGAVEFEGKRLHPQDMPLSLRRRITMVHQRPCCSPAVSPPTSSTASASGVYLSGRRRLSRC